jgi:pilus assembly protein CpaE
VRWKSRYARRKSSLAGSVISVIAPSGGSGASTVAVNVAAALAKQHGEVGLIDLRLSTGDLAAFLDLVPQHTLGDLSNNFDRMDATMLEMAMAKHQSGIRLLAAPREYSEVKAVTAAVVRQTTALARRRFPYVVIDLENIFSEEQVEALWQSDVTLMVVRLDYTSLRNAQRAMSHLQEIGLELDRVKVVANRYGERKQLSIIQAKEVLQKDIAYFVPDDPSSINRAVNEGIPVLLQRPYSKVARSLSKLAAGVNGKHR